MFGFTPAVFEQIERHLIRFLEVQRQKPDNSECLIPEVVNQIVKEKAARVRVCPTSATWFGVTYPQDKAGTMQFLQEMVERGEYPSPIGKGV
jgi:sulfur relay (sulfurtransferase) complex TusBCD TusD component (DsrE family)